MGAYTYNKLLNPETLEENRVPETVDPSSATVNQKRNAKASLKPGLLLHA